MQLKLFFTALMFYTRIPVPVRLEYTDELLNKSTRYLPLVGAIVGIVAVVVLFAANLIFPFNISVLFSIVATIMLTGAFHEDGFADFCDGFGGGYSKEEILHIMKDSRNGSYGVAGMILIFLFKYISLVSISLANIAIVYISAHVLSRLLPVLIIKTTTYSRFDETTGKIKPLGKNIDQTTFLIAFLLGVVPLLFFSLYFSFTVIVVYSILTILFRKYIVSKIEGYTGDTLGALQQIAEVIFYLTFIAYQNFATYHSLITF